MQAYSFSTNITALTTRSDYSAWNQCVAEALRRFDVDLYHINDYHATVAPLYLLPSTIPCCLSLHNAEFQGMWSLKSTADMVEICQIFNLSSKVVASYVQFGEVFNLLHAGASILRVNQYGFGSVGVSKKYGKRAYARYPIFWGLTDIGALPNPDPSDFAAWDKMLQRSDSIHIDNTVEAGRGALRIEAQQWAGLTEDPQARFLQASDDSLLTGTGRALCVRWSLVDAKRCRPDCRCLLLGSHRKSEGTIDHHWPCHRSIR
jgi:alpha-1,3-glucan synthase